MCRYIVYVKRYYDLLNNMRAIEVEGQIKMSKTKAVAITLVFIDIIYDYLCLLLCKSRLYSFFL